MLIGVVADTHDKAERLLAAIDALRTRGARCVIHCGDITNPEAVRACAGMPAYFVFGNNDRDRAGLRRAIAEIDGHCLEASGELEIGGRRLAVTHGDDRKLVKRLIGTGPDYLFVGHAHRCVDRTEGDTRVVNPGALHRAARWTFALLDLATDELEYLTLPKPD